MKALLGRGLAIALTLWAGHAGGQEVSWRSSTTKETRGAALGLGRPIPRTIIRGQNADPEPPGPLPAAPITVQAEPLPAPPKKTTPADATAAVVVPGGPTWCGEQCAPAAACCAPVCGLFSRGGWGWGGLCGNDPCGIDPCGVDACCPPRPRYWIGGGYLLGGVNDMNAPTLLMTGTATSNNPQTAALLNPMTVIDGDSLENETLSGGRLYLGFWFPRRQIWGMGADFFVLGRREERVAAMSDAAGNPALARPFFNARNNQPSLIFVSLPGAIQGSFNVDTSTYVWGLDAHFRRKLSCGPCSWCDLLIGYRHLNVDETLTMTDTEIGIPGGGLVGTQIVTDRFGTQNQFNGFMLGLQGERQLFRRWFLQGTCKLSVGNVRQTVDVMGMTNNNGALVEGGILATATNIGKRSQDRFAVVPEVGVKFGFDLNQNCRFYVGYDVIYLSSAVRPGDQIDLFIDPALLPGGNQMPQVNRPAPQFNTTGFWAQGVNFGMELRY